MSEIYNKHIQNAIKIVENVQPEYKQAAFKVILEYMLSNEVEINQTVSERKIPSSETHVGIEKLLRSHFDWSTFNIHTLKPTPQVLLILKIAKENFGINELTASEIGKILVERFRINKSTNALSMLLMEKLGKYVDRIQEGNKFYYRITANGQKFVESEIEVSNQNG